MLRSAWHILLWLGDHVSVMLLAGILIVGGVLMFIRLADGVVEGKTRHFDDWVIRSLRQPVREVNGRMQELPLGPPWLHEVARDLTALGGITVLLLVMVAVVCYLLILRKYHAMWLVLVATFGGLVLSVLLKQAFHRPRPMVLHAYTTYSTSFPSGHSMLSAVVYLTLGTLLTRLTPGRIMKVYLLSIAVVLCGLVGLTRVYLGVHYPTDVLGGWTAGFVWALLCWLVAKWLQRRGSVENEAEEVRNGVRVLQVPSRK